MERPCSKLRRSAARKHRRSSGRDGARGPRRPWRARMMPAGQPRSSSTHRLRCPGSPRTLARSPAPAARPGYGHSRKGGVGGAGRPALYAETLAPLPQPTQNTVRLAINYAARCRLQARPDVRWSHPRRRLPRLRPVRPGRSGREVAKDAGRRRLAHLLGERVKPLISIDSSAHYYVQRCKHLCSSYAPRFSYLL